MDLRGHLSYYEDDYDWNYRPFYDSDLKFTQYSGPRTGPRRVLY